MNTSKISLGKIFALLVLVLGQAVWADVWDGVTKTPAKMQKIDGKDYFLIETAANLAWFSDTVNQIVRDTKWNAMIEAINKDASNKDKKSTLELMEKIKQDPEAYYTDPEKKAEWYKAPDTTYLKVAWEHGSVIPVEINAKITAEYLDMNNKPFVPIATGNGSARFAGVFEGNGVPIKNLRVDSKEFPVQFYDVWAGYPSYCQNVGLFGVIGSGGVVRNVVLDNAVILATGKNDFWKNNSQVSVGPIAGWVNGGTIDTCYVSGMVITNGRDVGAGGIVGAMNDGHIKDALSTASIEASGKDVYVGGIVGVLKVKSSISTSVYDGDNLAAHPDDEGAQGALVGRVYSGTAHTLGVCYYDSDDHDSPVGTINSGAAIKDTVYAVSEINTAENACILNRHEWSGGIYMSSCKNEEGNDDEAGVWANDISSIVNNGVGRDDDAETEYMITFDANGGGFYVDKVSKMLKFNSPLTTDDILEPYWGYVENEKIYKKFDGWSLSKTEKTNLGLVYGATTVYALWIDVPVYTITFDFNTGNGAKQLKTDVLEGGAITLDDFWVDELPSTNQVNGKMYYFKGWSVDKTGPMIESFGTAAKNTTFYAIWGESPSYKVTYVMRGHGVSPDVEIVSEGMSATVPADPSAADYIFDGWYTDTTYSKQYDFNAKLSKDVVLYAKWVPVNYSIVYNINDGTNSTENPMTYTVEDNIEFKAPVAKADSLEFKGWFFDGAFTQKADRIMPGSKTGDLSLYAKWGTKSYVISYSAGQYGTGNVEPVVKAHGFPVILQGESYQRKGYVQDGWSIKDCKDGCDKNYDLWGVYEVNSSIVLYPHWHVGETSVSITADTNRVTVYIVGRKGVYAYNGQEQVLSGYEIYVDNLRYSVSDIFFSGDSVVKGIKNGVYVMGLDSSQFANKNSSFKVTFKVTDGSLTITQPFIVVKYGDYSRKDTIHVFVDENDSDYEINKKIDKAFDKHVPHVDLPIKKADEDSVYVLDGWKKNTAKGWYEPVFKGMVKPDGKFRINFHLPEGAELVEDFDGYEYGVVTLLPDAVLVDDESWIFKGWYTKSKGRGNRVKAMRETDYGNKSLYPLFQKTVRYDAGNERGEIEVLYTDRAEITIDLALQGVAPKDFYKGGARYTFAGWVLEDGVYTATFKRVDARFSVALDARTLEIQEAQMGARYVVFGKDGRIVKRGVVSNGSQRVDVPKSGSYTVRVDKAAVQVNVK